MGNRRYPEHPRVGVGGVVFDLRGRVLLIRRGSEPLKGFWSIPGGILDLGETMTAGVRREVLEETGLIVRPEKLVGLFPRPAGEANGPHGTVSILYLCVVEGGPLACSPEGLELRYWDMEEVPEWYAHHERLARAARDAIGDTSAPKEKCSR